MTPPTLTNAEIVICLKLVAVIIIELGIIHIRPIWNEWQEKKREHERDLELIRRLREVGAAPEIVEHWNGADEWR
jgi:hypothetical protein